MTMPNKANVVVYKTIKNGTGKVKKNTGKQKNVFSFKLGKVYNI